MKRLLIFKFLVIVCICGLLSGNEGHIGNGDWSYVLSNEYEIWHISSKNIILGKKSGESSLTEVVSEYIVEFCYNNDYVCVKRVDVSDIREDLEVLRKKVPEYYIVDMTNDIKYGPFTETEYFEQCCKLETGRFDEWIKTYPAPDGVVY